MHPILNVVVVSFHHKRGCEVEYSHPKLDGSGEAGLPDEWHLLPSLALPDGVHNCQKDTIFFLLPSKEEPRKCVFGISCYRQIDSKELLNKSDDVTRASVQKAVCVLSRIPLFGPLKAKLEVITQAYFEQKDFSKVDVLAQMYTNLCDIFDENLTGEYFSNLAHHEISIQELFVRFRHRALLLFKLFLLERKVLFIAPTGLRLGETMLAIVSMFPKLLEEGLYYATIGVNTNDKTKAVNQEKKSSDIVIEEDVGVQLTRYDPLKEKDSCGFPLSLFTQGCSFDPYLSIQSMDYISKTQSYDGSLVHNHIEFVNDSALERVLALTSADLRFADFVLKKVEEQMKTSTSEFDGSDEWIRLQMKNYLLGLVATSRSDLQAAVPHFGVAFVNEWRRTKNHKIWVANKHEDLASVPPGHMFSEQMGVYDVYLRFEHAVNGVEGASKVIGTVNTAGKNLGTSIGETGSRVKAKFTNWWNRKNPAAQEGIEQAEEPQSE
ncbi:Protein CBG19677 [Caenorhabditis briggsae]|uniref:Protein CBG19677 n=1 Tax=Caenorhabditis briggsae TaxID=6238 RepID=A8XW62_CAEBR|nr:Protein CBG19677 [Caenorhabditis briggsae]CAP36881.2 Protein CBG19677 [Caenorhabditis briggsae]